MRTCEAECGITWWTWVNYWWTRDQDKQGLGQQQLLNVLRAYSIFNAEVGYCKDPRWPKKSGAGQPRKKCQEQKAQLRNMFFGVVFGVSWETNVNPSWPCSSWIYHNHDLYSITMDLHPATRILFFLTELGSIWKPQAKAWVLFAEFCWCTWVKMTSGRHGLVQATAIQH